MHKRCQPHLKSTAFKFTSDHGIWFNIWNISNCTRSPHSCSLLRYPGLRQPEVEACDLALPTREDLKLIEETREEKVIVMANACDHD